MPKRIMLEQGSSAWKAWRRSLITASDAAVIMGCGFKTINELYEEKLGLVPCQEPNPAMQRGTALEPEALAVYNKLMASDYKPMIFQSEEDPYLGCSMDGVFFFPSGIMRAVEIKCCGSKNHEKLINDEIPDYYMAQIQHQLLVLGLPFMDLFAYHPDSYKFIAISRDHEWIDAYLEKALAFWRCVKTETYPEPPALDMNLNPDWFAHADGYKTCDKAIKGLEDQKKVHRDVLISLADGKSAQGHGIKLTKIVKDGTIDYIAYVKAMGFEEEVEKYRKDNVIQYRITTE